MDTLFGDAAERLFAQTHPAAVLRAAQAGHGAGAAWQACVEAGFADALTPEQHGGAGLALPEALPLALAAGAHVLSYPLVQTLFARAWLHQAGCTVPDGTITLAPFGVRSEAGLIEAALVPWARTADHVLAATQDDALLLPMANARLHEPPSHGSLDAGAVWQPAAAQHIPTDASLPEIAVMAAAAYTALSAGAMQRVLELTLAYADQRVQFGRSIGRFQAVQQQISVMAEHTWAARMAAQMAFQSGDWRPRPLWVAVGKARTSQAAPIVADIAHAVHGAIGITEEHDLQLYTRLLREWRLAAGAETYWQERIGASAIAGGANALDFMLAELTPPEPT